MRPGEVNDLSKVSYIIGFPGGSVVKNFPVMHEMQVRFLGQEDPLEKENGNPLQDSCLGNPMERGTGQIVAHWVTKELDTTY